MEGGTLRSTVLPRAAGGAGGSPDPQAARASTEARRTAPTTRLRPLRRWGGGPPGGWPRRGDGGGRDIGVAADATAGAAGGQFGPLRPSGRRRWRRAQRWRLVAATRARGASRPWEPKMAPWSTWSSPLASPSPRASLMILRISSQRSDPDTVTSWAFPWMGYRHKGPDRLARPHPTGPQLTGRPGGGGPPPPPRDGRRPTGSAGPAAWPPPRWSRCRRRSQPPGPPAGWRR